MPIHENVVRHYANVEIYDVGDEKEEDCLGWITIMEKCETNLRTKLESDNLDLDERKKIAKGIQSGFQYLEKIGISHRDRKLANFLLNGEIAKICDFGLVRETSGRKSYRNLGYTTRGSKYKEVNALCKFLILNYLNFYFSCRNARIYGPRTNWWIWHY